MNTEKQTGIFIVDDNKFFSLALKADIENAFIDTPVKIQLFETGEQCIQKFKEENPQIVILDYHLNSKYPLAEDGIKVLDRIKKENKEAFVIMLTFDDHIDIAIKSFQHGASDYIVKTDTKFRKINFSLLNLFKIIEANRELAKYKRELNEYKENSKS